MEHLRHALVMADAELSKADIVSFVNLYTLKRKLTLVGFLHSAVEVKVIVLIGQGLRPRCLYP